MSGTDQDARRLTEALARASYGRLLAIVAARTGDIIAAEDALAEAFATALSHWPRDGVPPNPEAWLVVTARRKIGHAMRHETVRARAERSVEMLYEETRSATADALPDERLKMLFVCAHPAIAPGVRTPLMLQTVLGLDADRIGKAFLVPGPTMGQRLVRAKAKIRDAGVPFSLPEIEDLPDRLQDVLNAIYAAFNTGWDDMSAATEGADDLAQEAIFLAQLVVDLMPEAPEAQGLLALMLYSEARRSARRSGDGQFVPLSEQDPALWQHDMISAAERHLRAAAALRHPGRYQTEAAIQSLHAGRLFGHDVDPKALVQLYDVLVHQSGSLGAAVSRAAAYLAADQPEAANAQLAALPRSAIEAYQPFWVVQARVLGGLGQHRAAVQAFGQALALTTDPSVAAFLEKERLQLAIS